MKWKQLVFWCKLLREQSFFMPGWGLEDFHSETEQNMWRIQTMRPPSFWSYKLCDPLNFCSNDSALNQVSLLIPNMDSIYKICFGFLWTRYVTPLTGHVQSSWPSLKFYVQNRCPPNQILKSPSLDEMSPVPNLYFLLNS